MKMRFVSASAAVLVAAMAGPAMAMDTIVINPLTATWSNATGIAVSTSGQGTSQATVSWGNPATSDGPSFYRFTSEILPISKAFSAVGTETFKIGTFEHQNEPIFVPPSLTGVRLTLNYGISINGESLGNFMSAYDFTHVETVNASTPCQFGGANGVGVNINGCADRVTFSVNQGLSNRFDVGGTSYQLEIGGFSIGGTVVDQFLTLENSSNLADLVGSVSVVPEPASWAMLIAGFGLVGATMRRRRQQGVQVLA